MRPNCDICKNENSEFCKDCHMSSYWGKCYFELDEQKETDFVNLVHRDRLYHFVDYDTTGKPIEFTSKSQWKKHLKKLGRTDDMPQGKIRPEDLKTGQSIYEKQRKHEEIKRTCAEAYREMIKK